MIKIINSNVFTIEKKSDNDQCYISGGIVEEYKIPKEYKFNSFKDRFLIPNQCDENVIVLDKYKKMIISYFILLLYLCINILKNTMNYII